MFEADKNEVKKAFSFGAGIVLGTVAALKFLVDRGIIKNIVDKLNNQLKFDKNKQLENKIRKGDNI